MYFLGHRLNDILEVYEEEREVGGTYAPQDAQLSSRYFNHVMEEIGEIFKSANLRDPTPVEEEIADAWICLTATLVAYCEDNNIPSSKLNEILRRKISKWATRVEQVKNERKD